MPAGQPNYLVVAEKKPSPNIIEKPDSFAFDNDQSAKYGQLVTVRVKQDKDDGKLCVTEIEGIPLNYDEDKDGDTETTDIDSDGE